MPISNAFTIEHHKIKRKKRRHMTKHMTKLAKVPSQISEIDDPIDEIEM